MKRILFVDPADFIGGAELFCLDLISAIDHRRFKAHLATNGLPEYVKRVPKNTKVHTVSLKRLRRDKKRSVKGSLESLKQFKTSVNELVRIVKDEQIDCIQSNSIRAHICAAIAGLVTRKKVLWFVHDFTFPKHLCYLLSAIPATIFYSSHAVCDDLKEKMPTKYHEKLVQIPNGFSVSKIHARSQKLAHFRTHRKIAEKTPVIGLIARIDWWKGQKEFILAAKKVHQKHPSARFVIIGDASEHDSKTIEYKNEITELIAKNRLQDVVLMTGFIKNIHATMKELDIVVHASITPEPFGRIILEAMALKKPVIASNMGGPKEIISNHIDGLLVDPRDTDELAKHICMLLENEKRAKQIAHNGYLKVTEKYDLKNVTQKLQNYY